MTGKQISNPTSTSGAGSHFEAKVAAYYMLALLASMPGRGLPSVRLNRVRLQQAPEGAPLDDIVLEGVAQDGSEARLDIQVKRKVSFAPKDKAFKDVCVEIAETIKQCDFFDRNHLLAVAIAKTSAKIEDSYQDVLTWARELNSASVFFRRLSMSNVANEEKRTFVETLRRHLNESGAPSDDETIWKVLRRFLILPFDFSTQGSATLAHVQERANHCLIDGDMGKGLSLWDGLVGKALEIAQSGGSVDQDGLRSFAASRTLRLANDRAHNSALTVVADSARHALRRIDASVGEVTLARQSRIKAIRGAFEKSRYVEIQGDSGVGKSGLLKRFGAQQLEQGRVLTIAPGSVTPRGWTHMRDVIGFSGTCREFLIELALEADAYILIDNLDRLTPDEQITALDILGEAAAVPGVKILSTARRPLDPHAPRWLSPKHLEPFNAGPAIIIDELNDDELEELREEEPSLRPLLENDHPARAVARNLFRLSRISQVGGGQDIPHTEVELMRDWWRTGDGGDPSDETDIRDRQRIIRGLAEHAAKSDDAYDVSSYPTRAVDRLIKQRTLVELENGKVDFHHDVLREWAIATLFVQTDNPSEVVDLSSYASPVQARALELACVERLFNDSTGEKWAQMLSALEATGAHAIWARTGLLSAAGIAEIKTIPEAAESILIANDGEKLCELIRTVRAVHVSPGREFYEEIGFDGASQLPEFGVPMGAAWYRLILWTNENMARISAKGYYEICQLYMEWGLGFLGRPPLGKILNLWFYWWLTQIEKARDSDRYRRARHVFGGVLSETEVERLEDKARIAFLTLAHNSPDEAKAYVEAQRLRDDADEAIDWIMKLSRSVAAVAPQELADLTCAYLCLKREDEDEDDDGWGGPAKRSIFRRVDDQFMPESPNQGPFLPLLETHPQIGLSLIRRIVSHAVERTSKGDDQDTLTVVLDGEPFTFTNVFSYGWTGYTLSGHCLVCALWALEQWGQNRIEKGEDPADVISDVAGENGAPAAFAGVIVHLIISNIDACQMAGAPFFGCPELLSIDLERPAHQRRSGLDLFGFGQGDEGTPNATARSALLSKASRSNSLLDLVGPIAVRGHPETKQQIRDLLNVALVELPSLAPEDTLQSPTLAAQHALNLLDEENWRAEDLNGQSIRRYHSPESEAGHFNRLQSGVSSKLEFTELGLAAATAVHDPTKSSPEYARRVVELVRKNEGQEEDDEMLPSWMSDDTDVNVALIAMRDGDLDLKTESLSWARGIFSELVGPDVEKPDLTRTQAIGTAYLGLVHSLSDPPTLDECRLILTSSFWPHDMQSQFIARGLKVLHQRSPRLVKSVLRTRIHASLKSVYSWQIKDEERERIELELRSELEHAIQAELDWMFEASPEPDWPALPKAKVRKRKGIRLGKRREDPSNVDDNNPPEIQKVYFEAESASIWISGARSALPIEEREWLFDFASYYSDWTLDANGLEPDDEASTRDRPSKWSNAICQIAADGFDFNTGQLRVGHFLQGLFELPEERFCSLMDDFLRGVDIRFFSDPSVSPHAYVELRKRFITHLGKTNALKAMVSRRRSSISLELGPALGRAFFSIFKMAAPPDCYLREEGIEQSIPFIPSLSEFARVCPSFFSAFAILSFVETGPRTEHLPLLTAAGKAWRGQFPAEPGFWIEQGIGRRLVHALDRISRIDSFKSLHSEFAQDIDELVSHLVALGLSQAAQLELRLSSLK